MIALVAGEVAVRRPDHVVVETAAGVGYRLAVSTETLRQVPAVGDAGSLHTHLVVREDALALYGFATEEERDLFLLLIGVQSSGRRWPLAVLVGRPAARARRRAGRRRRRPAARRARHRQAHGRADRRRAAREGRRRARRPGAAITVRRADDPRALARDGLVELGFSPAEARAAAGRRDRRDPPRTCSPARCGGRAHELSASVSRGLQTPDDGLRGRARPLAAPAARWTTSSARTALKDQLAVSIQAARPAARRSTTCCSPARPGWARRRWRRSSPPSSRSPFVQTAGPALERKGDIAAFLTALEPRSSSSSTRSTASAARWRRPSIRRWRTASCRSPSARARARGSCTLDAAAVHARRRDDPRRAADHAAARPLRHPAPPRALRRPGARGDRPPHRRNPRLRDRRGRRRRDRPRSRGTPRVANRLLKRVRDYAEVRGTGVVDAAAADAALELLEIDDLGPRPPRPRDPRRDLPEVRRRPGRPLDARGHRRRGAGHDRGRLRALPAAVRLPQAHAARPRGDRARVRASRPRAARASRPCSEFSRALFPCVGG